MSTFTSRLDQLEAQLQAFIEDKLARLSPLRGDQGNLARRLVSAMRSAAISSGDGVLLAPDRFTVLAHPSQAEVFSDDLSLLVELADLLQKIGKEANLHFVHSPIVGIVPNEDVKLNQVEVIARFSERALSKTADLSNTAIGQNTTLPLHAFLIVNGRDIFVLEQSVINIGRRGLNDLIIDDPRVSRQHAQLRATRGRYELFDLDSTGGTFINKKRITQAVLHAGDVISLAGVPLIYGQEITSSPGSTQEYPLQDDESGSPEKRE